MNQYVKPVVLETEELAEGVYAASGDATGSSSEAKCDSKYMNGVYRGQDYSGANGYGNLVSHGCTGCPAFRDNGCGLQVDAAYLEGAISYGTDAGNRMPDWERQGKDPNANNWE